MKPGLVCLNGNYRPITGAREIIKGRSKGCVEVCVGRLKKTDNKWGMSPVKMIVRKDQVKRYPQTDSNAAITHL